MKLCIGPVSPLDSVNGLNEPKRSRIHPHASPDAHSFLWPRISREREVTVLFARWHPRPLSEDASSVSEGIARVHGATRSRMGSRSVLEPRNFTSELN